MTQPRPDLRLLPAAVAVWLTALGATLTDRPAPLLVLGAAGGVAGVLLLRRGGAARRVVGVAALGASAMAAVVGIRLLTVRAGPLPGLAAQRAVADLELVVTGDPRARSVRTIGSARAPDGVVIPARVLRVSARGRSWRVHSPVVVLAPTRGWARLLPSQHVGVTARLAPGDDRDITAVVTARGPPGRVGRASLLQRVAGELRAGLRRAARGLPPDERGLLPGLVDGDTSGLPPGLVADCRTTGLTHLVAVSGTNVAFVAAAGLFAARWAGLRARAVPAAGLASMVFFVVLARPEPSVLRATVTGTVGVLAMVRGGRRTGVASLLAAVVVLLLLDPPLGRSYGFALSVLATGGLLVLAPGWRRTLAGWLPGPVADALAVSAAAQLMCAPLLVLLSGTVSLVAVPANLLAAPAVAPATVLGVVTALLALPCPPLAAVAAHLAALPVAWIVLVARLGARAPYATLPWSRSWQGAVLLALLTLAALVLAPRVRRRPPLLAACCATLLVLASPFGPRQPWPPPGWLMVACDVGQGDALVVATQPRHAVLVDAGPDPRAVDACLRRLGVRTLDVVILTHFHADHVEGLPGALDGRRAGVVVVSPLAEPPDEAIRVHRWAAAAAVPVRIVTMGEHDRVGPVSWQVLWPARIIRGEGSDPNNASIAILLTTAGVRILLTGDVEAPAQAALLDEAQADGVDLRADVLKVAHHGSANQDPQLLAAVAPRLAVVSVGKDNPYGHPSPQTMAMLSRRGVPTARTDRDGDVAVVGPLTSLRLATRRR
ncbi:MAG TPA: ComEC/Rec2 family competence protein [Actinomycetes bacterium]|nr:ComEC/Rec2 family competence protein [Actinomycetes bacterium]